MAANPREQIGDNSGGDAAAVFEQFQTKLADWLKGWNLVAKAGDVTEETAEKRRDFYAGIKKFIRIAEEARKAEKQPHADAAKAVDERWATITRQAGEIERGINQRLDAYLKAKKREAERVAAEARAIAEAKEREAKRRELEAATAKDEATRIQAAEAARVAAAEAEGARDASVVEPVRIGSATGLATNMGLRKTRRAQIDSIPRLAGHFIQNEKLRECLQTLADAEIRAAKGKAITIPGVTIIETESL